MTCYLHLELTPIKAQLPKQQIVLKNQNLWRKRQDLVTVHWSGGDRGNTRTSSEIFLLLRTYRVLKSQEFNNSIFFIYSTFLMAYCCPTANYFVMPFFEQRKYFINLQPSGISICLCCLQGWRVHLIVFKSEDVNVWKMK